MTRDQKKAAIAEAIQNSRDNGYNPDAEQAGQLAIDLWMSSECEDIEYEERLELVLELRAEKK